MARMSRAIATAAGIFHPIADIDFIAKGDSAGAFEIAHHRKPLAQMPAIERRTVRVVYIIISGRAPEDRLPQKPDHGMQTVVDGSRISERIAGNIVQSRGLVQLPERQRANVGTDLRAMEFQPHPPAAPDCRNRA